MKLINDIIYNEKVSKYETPEFKKRISIKKEEADERSLIFAAIETGDRIWGYSLIYKKWFRGIVLNKFDKYENVQLYSDDYPDTTKTFVAVFYSIFSPLSEVNLN